MFGLGDHDGTATGVILLRVPKSSDTYVAMSIELDFTRC